MDAAIAAIGVINRLKQIKQAKNTLSPEGAERGNDGFTIDFRI